MAGLVYTRMIIKRGIFERDEGRCVGGWTRAEEMMDDDVLALSNRRGMTVGSAAGVQRSPDMWLASTADRYLNTRQHPSTTGHFSSTRSPLPSTCTCGMGYIHGQGSLVRVSACWMCAARGLYVSVLYHSRSASRVCPGRCGTWRPMLWTASRPIHRPPYITST